MWILKRFYLGTMCQIPHLSLLYQFIKTSLRLFIWMHKCTEFYCEISQPSPGWKIFLSSQMIEMHLRLQDIGVVLNVAQFSINKSFKNPHKFCWTKRFPTRIFPSYQYFFVQFYYSLMSKLSCLPTFRVDECSWATVLDVLKK